MTKHDVPTDPYAAPPAPKERGGPVLRFAIVAALLVGAGWGWSYLASQPRQPLVPTEEAAIEQPIQVADAGRAAPIDSAPAVEEAIEDLEQTDEAPATP